MGLSEFVAGLTTEQKDQFCAAVGTNRAYLSQLASGNRKAGHELARKMVAMSQQMFPRRRAQWLTLETVRPDIWSESAA